MSAPLSGDPEGIWRADGVCVDCLKWAPRAVIVAEVHSNSAAGYTVVAHDWCPRGALMLTRARAAQVAAGADHGGARPVVHDA